ncbi:cornifelin homolog A-like [Centroberyx gerrardi]|uniref:cornifelin homolog A-like n=1 Tax=Centroberyx gerrardi TaxID=166262 RepID=UPI003AAC5613
MAVHPMPPAIVTVQPGMFRSPADLKTEMWTSSLFNCCDDMGVCCLGFWCPCCLACQVSSDFGECLCLPLVDVISGGTVPAATMAIRSTMRERYHIQGSMFDDCCIVTFCSACAWCQMAREVKIRKRPLLLNTTHSNAAVEVTVNPLPHAPTYVPQPLHPLHARLYPPMP